MKYARGQAVFIRDQGPYYGKPAYIDRKISGSVGWWVYILGVEGVRTAWRVAPA